MASKGQTQYQAFLLFLADISGQIDSTTYTRIANTWQLGTCNSSLDMLTLAHRRGRLSMNDIRPLMEQFAESENLNLVHSCHTLYAREYLNTNGKYDKFIQDLEQKRKSKGATVVSNPAWKEGVTGREITDGFNSLIVSLSRQLTPADCLALAQLSDASDKEMEAIEKLPMKVFQHLKRKHMFDSEHLGTLIQWLIRLGRHDVCDFMLEQFIEPLASDAKIAEYRVLMV